MVKTFGNNIISAYTGGNNVKEIYSFGEKVWPDTPYTPVDYIRGRSPVYNNGTLIKECPTIKLDIPYISGGFTIKSEIMNFESDILGSNLTVFVDYYNNENNLINAAYISSQGPGSYSVRSGYTRGNIGTHILVGNHILKQTIPSNNINTKLYVDSTEVVNSDDYSKTSHSFSISETITIYIFGGKSRQDSCIHYLKRFVITNSDNQTLYELVPMLRNSDNQAGLYDIINNVFYTKQPHRYNGTTVQDFIYGNF